MVEERPYDQRPAARPIEPTAPPGGAPSAQAMQPAQKKTRRAALLAVTCVAAAIAATILVVNLNKVAIPEAATPMCVAAFATASTAMNQHYETHPLFGPEYDAIYADGVVSDEEQVTLDAILEDESVQFAALVDPIYDACTGVEDLYAGAFAHRDEADWALLDVESMTTEEIKAGFIFSHCYEKEFRPSCSDFVLEDWNRKL